MFQTFIFYLFQTPFLSHNLFCNSSTIFYIYHPHSVGTTCFCKRCPYSSTTSAITYKDTLMESKSSSYTCLIRNNNTQRSLTLDHVSFIIDTLRNIFSNKSIKAFHKIFTTTCILYMPTNSYNFFRR